MIATFKEQTEAVLWLPPLMTKPRLCYDCHRGCAMIATFKEQTEAVLWLPPLRPNRGCAMIATFKEQTEAVLWLPPLKNKPRLCYDCHL